MSDKRVLTGITTSGSPHLGNYVGAIRPAVRASLEPGVQSFYFLADYHALIKVGEPARIQRSTLEIAATWLAAGLNPDKVVFYRQSDIPEIPELTWLLTCLTGKGLLNRVAEPAQLDEAVESLVASILSKPRLPIEMGKQLFYRQIETGMQAAYDDAAQTMACNMMDASALEGVQAFIDKRPPRW